MIANYWKVTWSFAYHVDPTWLIFPAGGLGVLVLALRYE